MCVELSKPTVAERWTLLCSEEVVVAVDVEEVPEVVALIALPDVVE